MTGEPTRIEHWINALDQGSYAAYNMLGKFIPYGNTPFFWTRHYNKSIQYIGHAPVYDSVHVEGSIENNKFIAYYIKDNKVLAIAGQDKGADMLTMFEAFNQNKMPPAEQITSGAVTPETLRKDL